MRAGRARQETWSSRSLVRTMGNVSEHAPGHVIGPDGGCLTRAAVESRHEAVRKGRRVRSAGPRPRRTSIACRKPSWTSSAAGSAGAPRSTYSGRLRVQAERTVSVRYVALFRVVLLVNLLTVGTQVSRGR